jgi:WD40 repeat protein/serine/threonine protein kinase
LKSDTGKIMPEKEAQTLTGGIIMPQDNQTMTSGLRTDRSILALNHTIGVGTGELVDKVNWEIGDIIDGRYEVTEIIGYGGMGIVYKINHLEWKLDLAVKVPLADLVADEISKARFIREAQTWVDLGLHPNIVQCWYVRELGGIPRVFMDYIEGGSLKDWIKEDKVKPGEWDRILDLIIQACDGLRYAHEHGVEVHRDIKPGNLLLTENGEILVTDFGVVKREGDIEIEEDWTNGFLKEIRSTITMTGSELGTPQYGAPEQWGEARHADARADIYALGVVLFELCCGRRPFDDGSHKEPAHTLIGRHLSTPAPDPRTFNSNIPTELAEVIVQCLAKEPEKRPESMKVFREILVKIYTKVMGKNYRRPVPQTVELRSDALNNRAASLLDLGKEKEAFEAWREALKLDPYHPESIYNQALLEWVEAKITDDEVIRRLEEIKHTNRRANLYLGFIHLERAAADEAEAVLAEALKATEFMVSGVVWRALGDARMGQEKFDDAEKAYQKALELIPEDFASLEGQTLAQVKTRQQDNQLIFPWQHCCRTFEGEHEKGVTAVAVTPNGHFIVSGSRDSTLRLWNLTTAECLRTFDRYRREMTSVAVTPNGRFIISGCDDNTLWLWDLTTARYLQIFEGHQHGVTAVTVTPNGRFAVSGSDDGTLRLWNLAAGKCLRTFEGHTEGVIAVAVTPNGRFVISGSQDKTLRQWDLATAKCLQTFKGHKEGVTAIAVTPNGRFIISGSDDNSLRLWDIAMTKCLQTFRGHKEGVTAVAVTPDGHFTVSGSFDRTLRLWKLTTGKCLRTFDGHEKGVTTVATTPDGRFAVSGSEDKTLRLWNLDLEAPRYEATIQVCRQKNFGEIQLSTKQFRKRMAWAKAAWETGKVATAYKYLTQARTISGYERAPESLALNADIGRILPRKDLQGGWLLLTLEGHDEEITAVAITPDGRFAMSGSKDSTLRLWELATAKCLRTFKGHEQGVTAVAVTPDGRFVVSGSEDKTLRLWDIATAKCLRIYKGHRLGVTAAAIAPYGQFLVSGSKDRTLRMWNPATANCLQTFKGHRKDITAVAVTSGKQFIISGCKGRTLWMWDPVTAKCQLTFEGHKNSVTTVGTDPNGRFIISGSKDRSLRMWEIASGKCLATFKGHMGEVTSVAMTSDMRFAISGSKDKTLRLWNCATGECVRIFEGHRLGVTTVEMTSDGRFVVSGSEDKTLKLWELDWELDPNETVDQGTEEQTKNTRFINRIASLLNGSKKK